MRRGRTSVVLPAPVMLRGGGIRGVSQDQTHKLDSVLHVWLMHYVGAMKFHRAWAYLERSGRFLARGSPHNLRQYHLRARCQNLAPGKCVRQNIQVSVQDANLVSRP